MNFSNPKTVILHDNQSKKWLCFNSPRQIIQTSVISEVVPFLKKIEGIVNSQNQYAAGFVSYDASPAFDNALSVHTNNEDFPLLLWFGIFDKPKLMNFSHEKLITPNSIENWRRDFEFDSYKKKIASIKKSIAAGTTYQVNYTFRLKTRMKTDPWSFFKNLVHSQSPSYSAFLNIGSHSICCASPELFFALNKNRLRCKPMKGTADRGLFWDSDCNQKLWLQNSEKNKAENVMIVDMIRNDMGKIAINASVQVKNLFACEKFPTLWQMTSTVECDTRSSILDIFSALFPCASITGAPKVSTVRIIKDLESEHRGLYTGSIGFIAPNRKAQFNVAIRTAVVDNLQKTALYGVGGGIVWQSKAKEEFEECRIKTNILASPPADFSLLETMLFTKNRGIYLLPLHCKRLAGSAAYFDFSCNIRDIARQLRLYCSKLGQNTYRIRLVLDKQGSVRIESSVLKPFDTSIPFVLSPATTPTHSANRFLYHKTTMRESYHSAWKQRKNCDDVVFYNEKMQVTETSIANIVVKKHGEYITPALSCGLLPGTMRQYLLSRKKIKEGSLTLNDLKKSKKLFIINSVRKWHPATIAED